MTPHQTDHDIQSHHSPRNQLETTTKKGTTIIVKRKRKRDANQPSITELPNRRCFAPQSFSRSHYFNPRRSTSTCIQNNPSAKRRKLNRHSQQNNDVDMQDITVINTNNNHNTNSIVDLEDDDDIDIDINDIELTLFG
eukprot:1157431_1